VSRAFLDSNILLCSIDLDDRRRDVAQDLLHAGGTISVQCLNEFAVVARRTLAMSWKAIEEARDQILLLCGPVRPTTLETHHLGFGMVRKHRFSFTDGMIDAAALIAGCDVLYSEGMHHGLVVDGRLRIENPFRG
jgi:predicted nucleic acid-binding protein